MVKKPTNKKDLFSSYQRSGKLTPEKERSIVLSLSKTKD
jgi:hypothetical protein